MSGLPIVKTFTIPRLGWTVTDYRNLDYAQKAQTESRWTKAVKDFVATIQVDHKTVLCQYVVPKQRDDFQRGIDEAYLADENIDLEAYARDHPVQSLRIHTGIENPATVLSVAYRDRIIGGIHVAVYVVESSTRDEITARSLLWVAVEPRRGMSDVDVKVAAITFMIDNDLRLDDGRVLDFIGYDQTSDVPRVDWGPERAPLIEFYDRLAVGLDRSADQVTGDFRFRRRGAPSRPIDGS